MSTFGWQFYYWYSRPNTVEVVWSSFNYTTEYRQHILDLSQGTEYEIYHMRDELQSLHADLVVMVDDSLDA